MFVLMPILYGYYTSMVDYNMALIVLWACIQFVDYTSFIVFLIFVIQVGFLVLLTLNIMFRIINADISLAVKLNLNKRLMHLIAKHNELTQWVHNINTLGSKVIFLMYFIFTPGLLMNIYVTHNRLSTLVIRFVAFLGVIFAFVLLFGTNYYFGSIAKKANKSLSLMYPMMGKTGLTLGQRLTVEKFMHRLSGHTIGFYCLDLFPMNNWQFFQLVYISGANYFLIMGWFG